MNTSLQKKTKGLLSQIFRLTSGERVRENTQASWVAPQSIPRSTIS